MTRLPLVLFKILLRRIRLTFLLANPKFILRMLLLDMSIQPVQRPVDLVTSLPVTSPNHVLLLWTSRAFSLCWEKASDCRASGLEECVADFGDWWWGRGGSFLGFALALRLRLCSLDFMVCIGLAFGMSWRIDFGS